MFSICLTTPRADQALQRYAIEFVGQWFYNMIRFPDTLGLPAPVAELGCSATQ
jgi:hypothetical protein